MGGYGDEDVRRNPKKEKKKRRNRKKRNQDVHFPHALIHLDIPIISRLDPIQLLYRQLQYPLLAGLELELGGYLGEGLLRRQRLCLDLLEDL